MVQPTAETPEQTSCLPATGSRRKSRDEEVYSDLFLPHRVQQKRNKSGGFCCRNEKTAFLQIKQHKRLRRMAAKAEKWSLPLVEKQRIWYNILHDAPSPSGKAGDFDSPIVGSTPAGATKSPVILKRLTGLFASLFHKMRLNGAKLSGGGSFWWACGGSSRSGTSTKSKLRQR